MAFKLKYRVRERFDTILLNKKVMLGLAVLAPVMFSLSALYLGGYFEGIKFPLINRNWQKNEEIAKTAVSSSPVEEKPSVFKDALRPLYGEAVALKFPNRNSTVNLVEVGLDSDNALEAPKDWKAGGWYKYGSRPGEEGNVIINAHYDDNFGRPAAFWELKNLKVDDKVFIEDRYGKLYAYSVTESFLVGINDPNRLQIFDGNEDQSVLTLVTCGGVWLPGRATYDKRLVVKAELVVE